VSGVVQVLQVMASTGGETSGIGALGIDPLAILAQAVTFLILFFVLKKFALKGIVETLEKRRKLIDKGVKLGVEMEAEKAKLDDKVEVVLKKARQEADDIIAQAHEESGAIVKEAETKAVEKVDSMIVDAHNKIDSDIKQARKDLEKETLLLIATATETIIKEKLDINKDAKLIDQALKEAK
jgi:F-type H+-transporting ATPase subunit b